MCFSASASFTASALLTGAGVYALKVTRRPEERAFAAVPLLFAVQQATEGVLWTLMVAGGPEAAVVAAARAFLLFAQVLWPVWVPYAVLRLEVEPRRKRLLGGTLVAGILYGAIMGWALFAAPPVAAIDRHHIHYTVQHVPLGEAVADGLYAIATLLPLFIVGRPHFRVLGLVLVVSYGVARLAFLGNVVSVWCYFAALISMGIILLLRQGEAHRQA